jgi:hypothetical protein
MSSSRRRARDGCIACAIGAAAVLAAVLVLPAGGSACTQVSAHWPQLNAWSSQVLLRPFALLLQAC